MKSMILVLALTLLVLITIAGCPRAKGEGEEKDITIINEVDTTDESTTEEGASSETMTVEGSEGGTVEGEAGAAGDAGTAEGTEGETTEGDTPVSSGADTEGSVVNVVLETNIGNIVVAVHKDWAPIGAEHWLKLVNEGYYDGAPFFRVMDGFMAQAGFSGDPELTKKYLGNSIQDDPVVKGNLRGTLSFGNSGRPNSRSSHFFINFADNTMLDTQRAPFPAFGEVIEGMDVVDKIFRTGENPPTLQGKLSQADGIEYFKQQYPEATFIIKAYVQE